MTETRRFLILTELNLLRAFWICLFHRNVVILAEHALVPRAAPLLRRVRNALVARSLAQDILDIFPEERPWAQVTLFGPRSDMFRHTEAWGEAYLNFDRWPSDWAPYSMAFRQIASKYWGPYYVAADLLHRMRMRNPDTPFHVIGAHRDFTAFYTAYFGARDFKGAPALEFRRIANLLICVGSTIGAIIWCLCRTRLKIPTAERIFLGVDYHGRQADLQIISDIVDVDDNVLFVYRNSKLARTLVPPGPGVRMASVDDGRIGLRELLGFLLGILRDGYRVFALAGRYASPLYYELAKMPQRHCMFAALCQRYAFDRFWGRDDYNFDHIIRTHEIRAAGGRSFGINHGLPTPEIINPSWRYIDFDLYYVFGSHLYEKYYAKTWAAGMQVRAIGTMGLSRTMIERRQPARQNTIVYFSAATYGEETLLVALETARALPHREFLIKIKNSRRADGRADKQIEMCADSPANVTITERDTYELLLEAEYALAGCTTVVAEAVQLGAKTFVLDRLPKSLPFYYRDFAEICVRSGTEAADRIKAIDEGTEEYPWESLNALVDRSGRNPYDTIREDMGLPALARARALT
jgi:hypothetical protein